MRLAESVIQQGIVHSDSLVRNAAIQYFVHSFSHDVAITRLAIQATELYGWEQAFEGPFWLEKLPLDEESLRWVVEQLHRTDVPTTTEWMDFRESLCWMLVSADANVLAPYATEMLALEWPDDSFGKIIAAKLDLMPDDAETCWRKLEQFCEEEKNTLYVDQVDMDYAHALIEALARHSESDRVLSLLAQEIDDFEGNPMTWMEGFVVQLAGKMRLEPAIPLILSKMHQDEEATWIDGLCEEALARIGSDAVVEAITARYEDGDFYFRMSVGDILKRTNTDFSAEKCLALYHFEGDATLKTVLAHALVSQFARESVAPMRQFILEGKADMDITDLRAEVLAAATLLDVDVPESEAWRKGIEEDQRRRKERFNSMTDFGEADEWYGEEYDEEWTTGEGEAYGEFVEPPTTISVHERTGRNEPCPCGSGNKYKKCCLRRDMGNESSGC